MRRAGMDRAHFRFTYNGHEVSAVFFVDVPKKGDTFKLMLYRIGVGVVVLDVHRGYRIETYLHENYDTLRAILGIDRHSRTRWSTAEFFAHLDNKCIPREAHPTRNECRPEHAAQRFRDDIEESDKIYFCGIIDWSMVRPAGEFEHLPQKANRIKTAALLGQDIADFCVQHHISTKWTADPTDAQRVRGLGDITNIIHEGRGSCNPVRQ